ncbi:MAG TPA: Crp/Fnr family transcriptional regulator [Niastella sp.]
MDLLLKTIRHYIPLSPEDETIIRSLFRLQKVQKGGKLLQAGAICKDISFIEEGLVRYYSIVDGEEKTGYFNKEGEFVCNYASYLPQTPSTTIIEALEACTIYSISRSNMQLLYEQVKYGERFGRLALEDVYMAVINQINSLYNDPPEVRYQLFLSRFPDIGQRIPQYYIASYVGIKPQSLSRIRKRLAEKH